MFRYRFDGLKISQKVKYTVSLPPPTFIQEQNMSRDGLRGIVDIRGRHTRLSNTVIQVQ